MPFLPLFTGIRHLAHVLTVPPTKACLLCITPAGLNLYIQAMPVGTYWVQSPGFPKIVYCAGSFSKCRSKAHQPVDLKAHCFPACIYIYLCTNLLLLEQVDADRQTSHWLRYRLHSADGNIISRVTGLDSSKMSRSMAVSSAHTTALKLFWRMVRGSGFSPEACEI